MGNRRWPWIRCPLVGTIETNRFGAMNTLWKFSPRHSLSLSTPVCNPRYLSYIPPRYPVFTSEQKPCSLVLLLFANWNGMVFHSWSHIPTFTLPCHVNLRFNFSSILSVCLSVCGAVVLWYCYQRQSFEWFRVARERKQQGVAHSQTPAATLLGLRSHCTWMLKLCLVEETIVSRLLWFRISEVGLARIWGAAISLHRRDVEIESRDRESRRYLAFAGKDIVLAGVALCCGILSTFGAVGAWIRVFAWVLQMMGNGFLASSLRSRVSRLLVSLFFMCCVLSFEREEARYQLSYRLTSCFPLGCYNKEVARQDTGSIRQEN